MKIRIIIILAIALVALAGCGKKADLTADSEPSESNTQTEATTVAVSDDVVPVENLVLVEGGKFSPETLTVKKGTEVTWVNKDTGPCWIASDPHPIHNGYSGFDAGRGIKQDETYKFTFSRVGTFSYHDHLDLTKTGKIIIEL